MPLSFYDAARRDYKANYESLEIVLERKVLLPPLLPFEKRGSTFLSLVDTELTNVEFISSTSNALVCMYALRQLRTYNPGNRSFMRILLSLRI